MKSRKDFFNLDRFNGPFTSMPMMAQYGDTGIFLRSVMLNHMPCAIKKKMLFDITSPAFAGPLYDHCYLLARTMGDLFSSVGIYPDLNGSPNHKLRESLTFNILYFYSGDMPACKWTKNTSVESEDIKFESYAKVGEFIETLSNEAVLIIHGSNFTYLDPEFERVYPGMLKENNSFHDKFFEAISEPEGISITEDVHREMAKTLVEIIKEKGTGHVEKCLLDWLANALNAGTIKSTDIGLEYDALIENNGRWFFAKQV